uniref:peptidylprolyl isomerase n=1 Tax=Chromera velia CCMP2878 TaxID=1169474 RepID=A0A0G4FE01_9ALVE|mmetsp:Transcript_34342/g.67873  ORF Transcript_34342/g.67873 Transcript_34342/m.67873 type:complete len:216 (-) Transcript_34342:98-745(-)|eukprot:Cvel_16534.t1-p1 / transcript=Cvel_16534.t1 / gene=Cvel_16534 / organism=Chromera_velia_CCMP2878 / gene_product=FK506-binding protein 1, putative / transcript_product=FK506-binding protein 1, putative / location=Cvel_scaffold1277:46802-48795(-) / protein_length=215 / sequence_SO=supercontig / SO=protein_coding / is_pseudo=false
MGVSVGYLAVLLFSSKLLASGFSLLQGPPADQKGRNSGKAGDRERGSRRSHISSFHRQMAILVSASALFPSEVEATDSSLEGFLDGPLGTKYKVLKDGTGRYPGKKDRVKIEYTAWLRGFGNSVGKFDTTVGKDPLVVPLDKNYVIDGIEVQVKQMREGETRRIWVPTKAGYADEGVPSYVPRGADLWYELTLDEVLPVGPAKKSKRSRGVLVDE